MNTYLISSFSIRLLIEELNKIINQGDNIVNINYDEVSASDIINECNYSSLLEENKAVIVRHFKLNADSKIFDKYINNPNPKTKLLLITDNIDKRSIIYKLIKDKGYIIEINELKDNEINTKINNYCKNNNISIDYNAINTLKDYNNNNYDLILNEIDKIGIETNIITTDVIEMYSSKLLGDDFFELSDAITSKDMKKTCQIIENFISESKDVVPFLSLLAGQYRIIYATKEINESNETIAKYLSIHPYRVKLAKEKSYLYTKEEIETILIDLCELDKKLKSANVNQYTLLKKFLMTLNY